MTDRVRFAFTDMVQRGDEALVIKDTYLIRLSLIGTIICQATLDRDLTVWELTQICTDRLGPHPTAHETVSDAVSDLMRAGVLRGVSS